MEIILNIMKSVLSALYQEFGASLLFAFMFMIIYMEVLQRQTVTKTMKQWVKWFKTSKKFRRIFLLTFYVAMVLFRTVLCRNEWRGPLHDINGGWIRVSSDGTINTEGIENIVLFIPLVFLICLNFKDKLKLKAGFICFVRNTFLLALLLTSGIEFAQLFFRLGTFQIADLVYNILGGIFGGIIFWICYRLKHRNNI